MPVSSHEDHIKHIHVDSIRPPERETIYYTSIFGIMGVVTENCGIPLVRRRI